MVPGQIRCIEGSVMKMKILAFDCSPRMKKSNTDRLLNLLLEGAE